MTTWQCSKPPIAPLFTRNVVWETCLLYSYTLRWLSSLLCCVVWILIYWEEWMRERVQLGCWLLHQEIPAQKGTTYHPVHPPTRGLFVHLACLWQCNMWCLAWICVVYTRLAPCLSCPSLSECELMWTHIKFTSGLPAVIPLRSTWATYNLPYSLR